MLDERSAALAGDGQFQSLVLALEQFLLLHKNTLGLFFCDAVFLQSEVQVLDLQIDVFVFHFIDHHHELLAFLEYLYGFFFLHAQLFYQELHHLVQLLYL